MERLKPVNLTELVSEIVKAKIADKCVLVQDVEGMIHPRSDARLTDSLAEAAGYVQAFSTNLILASMADASDQSTNEFKDRLYRLIDVYNKEEITVNAITGKGCTESRNQPHFTIE